MGAAEAYRSTRMSGTVAGAFPDLGTGAASEPLLQCPAFPVRRLLPISGRFVIYYIPARAPTIQLALEALRTSQLFECTTGSPSICEQSRCLHARGCLTVPCKSGAAGRAG